MDRWAQIRRLAAREAIQRGWGHVNAGAADDAARLGRLEKSRDYRRKARRHFKRAARLRRAVLAA